MHFKHGLIFLAFLTACTDKKGHLDEMECVKMKVAESCHTWAKKLEGYDMAKAMEVYAKACKMNHAEDCLRLGDLVVAKSPSEAQSWYKRGCDIGHSRSCLKHTELMLKRAK